MHKVRAKPLVVFTRTSLLGVAVDPGAIGRGGVGPFGHRRTEDPDTTGSRVGQDVATTTPAPQLDITPTQRQLTWLALVAPALPFLLIALEWSAVPERVPMHFNGAGEVDGWGSRYSIFLLPSILGGTTLFMLLVAYKTPVSQMNIPFPVTEQNAAAHYTLARTLLLVMAAAIAFTGAYLSWETLQVTLGGRAGLSDLTLPLILGATLLPIGWYFWRGRQIDDSSDIGPT